MSEQQFSPQPRVDAQTVRQAFIARYDEEPDLIVRAPGRVNLIGEHTDYNDGFVLPMAIERAAWIALRPRPDKLVRVHSLDFNETAAFDLDRLAREDGGGWTEYLKGVAWALQEGGLTISGWEGVLAGDVPLGAGLSSSAAVELATARAFTAAGALTWQPATVARLAQKAENEWVGMNCGIMDQLISASGEAGSALLIDCRSLETTPVPLPSGTVVVIMDTNTRRGLVDSAYNERRAQCEAAAAHFGVPALRDVDESDFNARAAELDPVVRRRARHVITENMRVLEAAKAMAEGNPAAVGKWMVASHESMRDDFEISSDALNAMVQCALQQPGCYGARMTGGGFAGCAVALVDANHVESFTEMVAVCYERRAGRPATLYVTEATEGAEVVAG